MKKFLLPAILLLLLPAVIFADSDITVDGYERTKADIFELNGMPAPSTSDVNRARFYFDTASGKIKVSENGGAYVDLVGSGGGGHTIQDEGVSLTSRTYLNFTGAGVTCTDDGVNNQTDCTITSGGGSGTMTTIKENGVQLGGADIVTLDFLGADFDLTESPDTEVNLVIAAALTRDAEWDTAAEINTATTDDDFATLTGSQTLTNKTLTTPTIGSFTNATHNHQNAAGGGTLDHGLALTGLADDDHTQYALLAGRAAGQVLIGGTGAGDDLSFQTTSNVSKGTYFFAELTSNGFIKTSGGTGALTVDTNTYLTAEVDGSTSNEIEVVDEAYTAVNFNGGTASAVSQDDFYDLMHIADTDDDGLIERVDTTTNGFVKTINADGSLSIDTSTYLTGNQTVTLSGDATGSGATAITVTVVDDSHAHTGATLSAINDDTVDFDDADTLWTATTIGAALEELNDSINAGAPNGAGAKVHWSQLLGVPAGFADGTDDGAGGSGYATIQEDGSSLTQRTTLNIRGDAFTASDDGASKTLLDADAELESLADLATNGLVTRTSAGTINARTITGTTSEITVTNGDGVSGNPTLSLDSDIPQGAIKFFIDGGGSALTTGVKSCTRVPFDFSVTKWRITAPKESGSAVVDIWKDTYANFPPTVADTIAGSEKPTLSSQQKNEDTSFTSFSGTITEGDYVCANVDSATTVTYVEVSLEGIKT